MEAIAAPRGARRARAPLARDTVFAALFAALTLAAWAALWGWGASPQGRWLQHPGWAEAASFAALCRTLAVPAGVHALAWLLMIAAMMLPTTWPLLATFRRVTAGRADAGRLVALVVAGYLAAWAGFGVVAYAADLGVRAVAAQADWFVRHGALLGAGVLVGAGLFQFSALKMRCLEQCRSPFMFVAARWHGRAPRREALHLGLAHGVFCVGCCWALMGVMFVVGMGALGWMLALAALMAAEKNLPWGRRLSAPVGVGLIAAGALLGLAAA